MADRCRAGIYWCAGGHRCQLLLREHRSDPWPLPSRYGLLIATRVRRSGREQLELRVVVDLPADERRAVELARLLVVGVDAAIRVLLAGRMWVKHRVRKG